MVRVTARATPAATAADLVAGATFTTPSRRVTDADLEAIVALGGYTHPLFADADHAAASPLGGRVLPGQGVLLLMGGLVEQAGRLGADVVALVGLDEVRFAAPVRPGDEVLVAVEVLERERRPDGRRERLAMRWRCLASDDPTRTHVELVAAMLLDAAGAAPADHPDGAGAS